MSYLVVGLSHQHAPMDVLERAAVTPEQLDQALTEVLAAEPVTEAMILSTCNRIELFTVVEKFHPGVDALVAWLADRLDVSSDDLSGYLQVSYDEDAVEHMMRVASGLDSMVVGEPQILGQLRTAYLEAIDRDAVGRRLHALSQHALRVGKRVHSDLGMHEIGRNIASVAVDAARGITGGLAGRDALVVGAGAMASLAAASLRAEGVDRLEILNRSAEKAQALAGRYDGTVVHDLVGALRRADVVVTALGSSPGVISEGLLRDAGPTVLIDLALPRNASAEAATLESVTYVGMEQIKQRAAAADVTVDGSRAQAVIGEEVAAFVARQRRAAVAPTLQALQNRAKEVIEAEVSRLKNRIPDVDARAMSEIEYAIERVVDKMLHAPQVRVRESAGTPSGKAYAEALQMLFGVGDQPAEDAVAPDVAQSARQLSQGGGA
ncbi:glutamyl-tRNA reductase [Blastococcus sp. Marseille-P5729]|uniref:glutamyl-tRNA reductase n=1 Tax=Blastococcus sp. Marseille-P5729 TaxID=2086582 RepID=UPI000D1030D7|nr:glutamyl-tRNA reductase [Blastococcus sp. Marseille-P5729]